LSGQKWGDTAVIASAISSGGDFMFIGVCIWYSSNPDPHWSLAKLCEGND